MKHPTWTEPEAQKNEILLVDLKSKPSPGFAQEIAKTNPSIKVISGKDALKLEEKEMSSVKFIGFIADSLHAKAIKDILARFPQESKDSLVYAVMAARGSSGYDVNEECVYAAGYPKALLEQSITAPDQTLKTSAENIGNFVTSIAEQTESILEQVAEFKPKL